MRTPSRFYLRLFLPFTVVLLTSSLGAWIIGFWMYSKELEERLEGQLKHAASVLATSGLPFTEELLSRFRQFLRADIILLSHPANNGLAHTKTGWTDEEAKVNELYRIWKDEKSNETIRVLKFNTVKNFYILILHELPVNRDPRYSAVGVLAPTSYIRAASNQVAWWMLGIAVTSTLMLGWIGHIISAGITRPISQLAEMARQIATGDREVRVNIKQKDEIGDLSEALNKMAAELSNYEDKLTQRSRLAALGQMSARVAHEIRNPLTAIKLHLQLLDEAVADEHTDLTKTVLNEIQRLELIVSGVLETGHPTNIECQSAELNSLILEVTKLFDAQLKHRSIELDLNLAKDLPWIPLDSHRIKQVILNLLNNACDELSQGGRILISTEFSKDNEQVAMIIEDSGPGISASERKALFTPLISNKKGGIGLGLSISLEFVELHGGLIKVGDSRLGGASFKVLLPAKSR